MADYKHPEVLVTTQWVAEHQNDPKIRLIEVDVDTTAFDQGHIAGAVGAIVARVVNVQCVVTTDVMAADRSPDAAEILEETAIAV